MNYFIPNIKLVGYGRHQSYQIECLKCHTLEFNFNQDRCLIDLFCDSCSKGDKEKLKDYLEDDNISKIQYLGNIKGWIIKSEDYRDTRSRYNYNKVYNRDGYVCQYCGYSPYKDIEFRPLHIDHIKPWSAGGGNQMENMVVSCSKCNLKLSDKWFDNFIDKNNS